MSLVLRPEHLDGRRGFARILRCVLCFALFGLVSLQGEPSRRLVVGCDADYPPYEYRDAQGRPAGFAVELLQEAAREAGLDLELRSGDFREMRAQFEAGRIDMLSGWAFTEERGKRYLYTVPHTLISWSIFVRKGGPRIRSEADLAGLTILAQRGDTYFDYAVSRGYHVVGLPNPQEALRQLAAGRGDCALLNKGVALYLLDRDRLKGIERLDLGFPTLKYGFVLHKGDEETLAKLNEAIFVLKESGRFSELYNHHFARLEAGELTFRQVVKRTLVIILPIGALFFLAIGWSWSLRGQVRKRTLALLRELSERRKAEASLAEREQNYRDIFNATSDALIILEGDGGILDVNCAMCTMFGYEREEALALTLGDISLGRPPYSQSEAEALVQRALEEGPQIFEWQCRRRDGKILQAEVTLRACLIGEHRRVISAVRDLTSLRKAEAEREELQDRLRQAEKLEAIGQLAGGVAHDFNNQLASIQGCAEILGQELADSPLRRYADIISKACSRSSDLTRQLLAFARKGKYLSVPVDLHEILTEVMGLIRHSFDKRIEISLQEDVPCPTLLGDPAMLENALMNLAINARDAMPQGGKLGFRTELRTLDADFCAKMPFEMAPGPYILLSIQDSGIGMDSETIQHIFEPFFTTKGMGRGTGLGLASVYGTVRQHRGAIQVMSEPGAGTRFELYLPQVSSAPETAEANLPIPPKPATARLLVAEDEPMVAEVVLEMLKRMGFSVQHCSDGEEAMIFYREHWREVDLVILDMIMPKLSGKDTFLAMKGINPDVKALIATGYALEGEAQYILDQGALGFLQKPFKYSDLAETLQAVLNRQETP